MFGKKTLEDVRSGATRSIVGQIITYFFPIIPILGAVAVMLSGLSAMPLAYLLALAMIASGIMFGGIGLGLNQFAAFNSRLREDAALKFGPPNLRLGLGDARHQFKPLLVVNLPIINRSNWTVQTEIIDHSIRMSELEGTNPRSNLDFVGSRIGQIIAQDVITPQIPAIIIDGLVDRDRMQGELHFSIKFGRRKPIHTLDVRYKISGRKNEIGEWFFQTYFG